MNPDCGRSGYWDGSKCVNYINGPATEVSPISDSGPILGPTPQAVTNWPVPAPPDPQGPCGAGQLYNYNTQTCSGAEEGLSMNMKLGLVAAAVGAWYFLKKKPTTVAP